MSFKIGDKVMVNQLNSNHPLARWSGCDGEVRGDTVSGYVPVDLSASLPTISIAETDLTAVSPQTSQYSTPTGGTYTTSSSTYPITTWQGVYQALTGHNPNEHLLSGIMTNLDTHTPYSTACECGVTKTFGEEAGEYMHSDYCPKYKKNPYGSEK